VAPAALKQLARNVTVSAMTSAAAASRFLRVMNVRIFFDCVRWTQDCQLRPETPTRNAGSLLYDIARMKAKPFSALIGLLCLAMGCEKRVPVPTGGSPGTPRIGWVIMVGDRENPDREFVCQSDPRTHCVMRASQPDEQTFTNTHFYFHSGTTDTKYAGTIQLGFLMSPHETKPNLIVKSGDSATNASVSGIVSSRPGRYPMRIDVVAESGGRRQIRDSVPVIVK
jgi:hypothetical protein